MEAAADCSSASTKVDETVRQYPLARPPQANAHDRNFELSSFAWRMPQSLSKILQDEAEGGGQQDASVNISWGVHPEKCAA